MKLINDNLKKAGYFNAVLIVIAIVLRIISFSVLSSSTMLDSIIFIATLVFGLLYSLNGYKKDSAKYYKAFLYLYLVSNTFSVSVLFVNRLNLFISILKILEFVLLFVLAFIKDLGANRSTNLSLLILIISVIDVLYGAIKIGNIISISSGFSALVLSCALCVFVSAKYKDKEARGAK